MFSQNLEERVILNYFGDFRGTLLDAGANDGVTFSNSRQLLLNGWKGVLVEPSEYGYESLLKLYDYGCGDVMVCHMALGMEDGIMAFHESGAHVPNGADRALVSTLSSNEKDRWQGVQFTETEVIVEKWDTFIKHKYCENGFDFITIDCEGMDWQILQQIDLTTVGCKCLCIEWNSNKALGEQFKSYCTVKHGMKLLHTNAENMIFAV